jgi:2-oxoglutarate ferredoxin oxidoreductase subunit alpha
MKGFEFVAATDEHMEDSTLISDVLSGLPEYVEERRKMHAKRMRKLDGLRKDTPPPELWGPKNADLTLIVWGSTWGAAHEAIQQIEEKEGTKVNSLEFPTLFPFHTERTQQILRGVKQSLAVEGNYTGQFSRLLRAETGYKPDHFYGRSDGEPFAARDIADKIREVVT